MAKNRKLLLEGNDDVHVVARLCQTQHFPDIFDLIDKKGIANLCNSLATELKASDLEVLGILVDADTDLPARWQSLSTILTRTGYIVPAQPTPTGTILRQADQPTVGIWVMPDNRLPGMLEDFIAALIPTGDVLYPFAKENIQRLPERRFPVVHQAKAEIHTWLAWQAEPGKPLGQAITARYLDATSAPAQGFMDWLQALFVG